MARMTIERLGHRGDGVGPLGFAAFALPDETVEGAVEGDRFTVGRVVAPSPDRRSPACVHFGACGGCALQHAADPFLATWKAGLVAAALAARGLEAALRPIAVSPPGARRRVTLAGRRTKKTVLLGFHGRGAGDVIPITQCPVAHPAVVAALPALADLVGLVASRKGEARVTATVSRDGLDVAAEGGRPLDARLVERLAALADAADWARLSLGGEPVATRRPPRQAFGRALVAPPPGGFLQATEDGEAALVAAVREAVGDARRVADLFAGSGTFALPLAERAAVHGVEGDAAALAALDAGWRGATGLRAVTTEARDLFRRPMSAAELAPFDAVVIDPPRAGAAAQAAALAQSRVARVAMVSCNPATFARDARLLVDGGFRLLWAQPVDQFRWSPHVEVAAAFAR
ncbi:MAG: class I SAM-dependent RNA methyltransferase [Rhodobacteraceae bacterium]|nr:MAG: class I SAM-dependent RNA methyltransferase [Paracoccaceae bacterium]